MVFKWKYNAKCEQPELLCFVDTETYEAPHPIDSKCTQLRFRLGVARFGRWDGSTFNGVFTLRFTNTIDFWRTLGENIRGKRVQWVFAHNIMFDLWQLGFPEMIDNGEFQLSCKRYYNTSRSGSVSDNEKDFLGQCSIDKGSVIIKGILSGKRINFIDTYNYLRGSVESIGDSIGIPKLPMPSQDDSEEKWFEYCLRDVIVIETAMTGLMREWKANDLGNWQPTIASLAYSAYRHRFMTRPVICHGDEDVSKIEHDSYYDGRTAAFFNGDIGNGCSLFDGWDTGNKERDRRRIDGPCYSVDVNSLYPSVMRGNDYPVEAVAGGNGRPIIWRPPSLEWLYEQLQQYLCVAICKIDTDADLYPVKTCHGTTYPKGKIWTTLCTPEIKLAIEQGHLRSVYGCVFYIPYRLFDVWVDYWWERKHAADMAANPIRRETCKVLLNSLGGKFAQRDRYWYNTNRWPCEGKWQSWTAILHSNNRPVSLRSIGCQVQRLSNNRLCNHALVAVSAHINSYARVRMIHDRLALPKNSVLYCANDGLILTEHGIEQLRSQGKIDTRSLGHYRTTGTYERASIYGPRDYECDGNIKKSGLPKDRQQISKRKWKVKRFESANGMIARPPDGSIHLYEETVSGDEHHWGMYDPGDGWLRPNLVDMWSK